MKSVKLHVFHSNGHSPLCAKADEHIVTVIDSLSVQREIDTLTVGSAVKWPIQNWVLEKPNCGSPFPPFMHFLVNWIVDYSECSYSHSWNLLVSHTNSHSIHHAIMKRAGLERITWIITSRHVCEMGTSILIEVCIDTHDYHGTHPIPISKDPKWIVLENGNRV